MEQKLIKEISNEVAYIWINRPEKKNAMDFDVWVWDSGLSKRN